MHLKYKNRHLKTKIREKTNQKHTLNFKKILICTIKNIF
jgi:hypothetical protein